MSEVKNYRDEISSIAKNLLDAKEKMMKKEWIKSEWIEVSIEKELNLIWKANEVENQWSDNNVGYDLVPTTVTMQDVVNVMKDKTKLSSFINAFTPWFQWTNLQKNVDMPIVWDIWFARGATEWTTWTNQTSEPTNTFATSKVSIPQKKLYMSTGISDYLQTFSIVDIIPMLRQMTADSFAHTVADAVLNWDSTATTAGNINSDDQAPATTFASTGGILDRRVLIDDWLRKQPLNWTDWTDKVDIWALETTDFFTLISKMRPDTMPSDLVMIMDFQTYYKAMTLSDFKDLSINWRQSTVSTWALTNIAWVDLFITDLMRKTEADGKLSATSSNNTKWQIIVAKRNVMQHGFGRTLDTNIEINLEKGILFEATAFYWQANINKKGGETAPSIICGYNITI